MATNKRKYWTIVAIASILPAFFAILDIIGYKMWMQVGGWGGEAAIATHDHYMVLFWGFAYLMIALIAFVYYHMTKDKSESIALFLVPFILVQFGAEDVFYYVFSGIPLFAEPNLSWLSNNFPIQMLANIFNGGIITGTILFMSFVIGMLVAITAAEVLYKKY